MIGVFRWAVSVEVVCCDAIYFPLHSVNKKVVFLFVGLLINYWKHIGDASPEKEKPWKGKPGTVTNSQFGTEHVFSVVRFWLIVLWLVPY